MNTKLTLMTVALLSACVAFGQRESSEVRQILESVSKNSSKVSYVGIRKVRMQNSEGKTLNFKEYVMRWNGKTRIEYPSDSPYAGLVVWEENGLRRTLTLASNEIRESRVRGFENQFRREDGGERGGGRGSRFDTSVKSGGKVAGQETKVVHFSFGGSRRQSMWIDSRNFVVLKRSFFDGRGQEVGGFEFERIKYNAKIDKKKFDLPKGVKVLSPKDELIRSAQEVGVAAYMLPSTSGLRLMSARSSSLGDQKMVRQFYDSGKEKVSLMLMKGDKTSSLRSGVRGRMKVYVWVEKGVTLALVGELDESRLKQLAGKVTVAQR